MRNQLQEHLQLQALIYKYIASCCVIEGGVVNVGMSFTDFNTPCINPKTQKRITSIDEDIVDMFAVKRDSYFFNWTEHMIGPIVTVNFNNVDTYQFYSGTMNQPDEVIQRGLDEAFGGRLTVNNVINIF